MAGAIDTQNKRGSIWHRWDPHIHTPGTALNNQYTGTDPWEAFLGTIEASDPPIRALGITDYFGVECYEQVVEQQRQGRLANVGLIFPNVELRLSIETSKASAVNIHLLLSPEDSDHVEQIKRFLLELDFSYQGGPYRCQRSDLIRLERAHQPGLTDDEAARSEGANQFKVKLDQLTEAWAKNNWVKKNALIAVAGGEKDGTSGLRDASASFAAQRKHVESIANIVFSATPQQINFWLGKGSASVTELESQYNGLKPCLHGSDAHAATKVGQPDERRFCWIKGDLSFESLRQVCIEPDERVSIGDRPPRGALEGHTINTVSVTNAPWISQSTIELNAGLIAVIGARGSGKTALADLIAAGGLALSPHLNERSFILRAKDHLGDSATELYWASGEKTGNRLTQADMEDLLDTPYVQYLSQQFVDQLCSAEGLDGALVKEIERVIFNAHALTDRLGTGSFKELLDIRLESSRQKRERQQQTLTRASADLNVANWNGCSAWVAATYSIFRTAHSASSSKNTRAVTSMPRSTASVVPPKPVTLDELKTRLGQLKAANPELPVVVKGDTVVQYGKVMEVLELLGQLDITQLGLVTQRLVKLRGLMASTSPPRHACLYSNWRRNSPQP